MAKSSGTLSAWQREGEGRGRCRGSSFPAPCAVPHFLGWRGDGHAPTPSALLLPLEGTLKGLAASQREGTIMVRKREEGRGLKGAIRGKGAT